MYDLLLIIDTILQNVWAPQDLSAPIGFTDISHDNEVNTMAADALAPCVARTSAAMVLFV